MPLELRYLSFSTPFVALLLAGALQGMPRVVPAIVIAVQTLAIVGLLIRPETMVSRVCSGLVIQRV